MEDNIKCRSWYYLAENKLKLDECRMKFFFLNANVEETYKTCKTRDTHTQNNTLLREVTNMFQMFCPYIVGCSKPFTLHRTAGNIFQKGLNSVTVKQNMAKVENLLCISVCISYTDSRTCTVYVKDVQGDEL